MTITPPVSESLAELNHRIQALVKAAGEARAEADRHQDSVLRPYFDGYALGLECALLVLGGTPMVGVAPVCSNPTCGHRHDHHGHAPEDQSCRRCECGRYR